MSDKELANLAYDFFQNEDKKYYLEFLLSLSDNESAAIADYLDTAIKEFLSIK